MEKEEKVIYNLSPSWLNWLPSLIVGWIVLIGLIIGLIWLEIEINLKLSEILISSSLVIILGVAFTLSIILKKMSMQFIVTNQKVVEKRGIISRKTREVELKDIKGINLNQEITQRIFGIGDIEIGSSATAGVEVVFQGIKNPEEIKNKIRELRTSL